MTATTGTESAYSCDFIFVVGFFYLGFSKIRKNHYFSHFCRLLLQIPQFCLYLY